MSILQKMSPGPFRPFYEECQFSEKRESAVRHSPVVHEAGAGISTVTPYDSVMSQSASGCLQRVCGFIGARSRALRVEACHGVHAFVPSMPGVVIAARLGPANMHENTKVSEQFGSVPLATTSCPFPVNSSNISAQ